MSSERIKELEKQIADLNRRWPAHSAPPSMMEELDDLEEELQEELTRLAQEQEDSDATGRSGH
jgi:hypothetical protein